MSVPSRLQALERLQQLADHLASNRLQLADLEAAAHRARVETWMHSDSEYISARDRQADFTALDLTCDILTLKGEIAADEDLRAFYTAVCTWGPE